MKGRANLWAGAAAAVALLLAGSGAAAQEHKYTGVKDCGKCHEKELMGDQNSAWEKGPHAKAYETLKGEKAQKIAAEKGLSVPPHEADECVKCHATAHGLEKSQIHRRPLALADGIQCESCHGPGSDYRKKKTMADREKSIAAGMWEPEKNAEICTACHNSESPTWDPAVGFDHAAAVEAIAHPIPEDVKGRYIELEKEQKRQRRAGGGGDEDEEEDDE